MVCLLHVPPRQILFAVQRNNDYRFWSSLQAVTLWTTVCILLVISLDVVSGSSSIGQEPPIITHKSSMAPAAAFLVGASTKATTRPKKHHCSIGNKFNFISSSSRRDGIVSVAATKHDGWNRSITYGVCGGSSQDWRRTPTVLNMSSGGGDGDEINNNQITESGGVGNKGDNTKKEELDWNQIQKQFKSFREIAIPYLEESNTGRWLFAGMIALTLMNSGVSVVFSYVGRDFWTALSSKDPDKFAQLILRFIAALCVGSPINVLYKFQRDKLSLNWREWMTDRVLQLYESNRAYYKLDRGIVATTSDETNGASFASASGAVINIDNPDQRIAEDIRSFTSFSLELFLTVITSIIDLVSFSLILYSIQPQLFGAIIAYSAFGTLTTTYLGKALVPLNFQNLVREADFRYSLVRLRDNAESIAFYKGEDLEGREISKRLDNVITKKKEIIVTQRNLEFFTTAYRYLIQILPVSVVAPQYFAGTIELGVVSQSNGAFNHILSDLSIIVNQFERLSQFSAGIERLSEFLNAIQAANGSNEDDGATITKKNILSLPISSSTNSTDSTAATSTATNDITETAAADATNTVPKKKDSGIVLHQMMDSSTSLLSPSSSTILQLKNVTLKTPDLRRTLIQNLSLNVPQGEHLLIVGSSGAGKSSLLRAIAGLWTSGSGEIKRPQDSNVYFLPQRPYCSLGTLRDQLLYPSVSNTTEFLDPSNYPEGHRLSRTHVMKETLSDKQLLDILKQVGLEELPNRVVDAASTDSTTNAAVAGLDVTIDWSNTLSLGEQQRLGFARLLVNRPQMCILDEATSALDMNSERQMYQLLKESMNQMTYVSVGHRPSLLNYHTLKLRVVPDDDCVVEYIPSSSSTSQKSEEETMSVQQSKDKEETLSYMSNTSNM